MLVDEKGSAHLLIWRSRSSICSWRLSIIPSTSAAVSSAICFRARSRVSDISSSSPAIAARISMRSRRCVSGISDKSTRKTALQRAFSAKNSGILDQFYIV